ncbi:MAG: GyrI-like domain-containing protein [Legionellales bacterium]|nr:GyrI-like domain-containing protein [Legionellales bacterium]
MKTEKVELGIIQLVGLSVRTNNQNELDPKTAKIGKLIQHYWENQCADRIQHRISPGVTYSVYTDYASDEHGDYTYFFGEAVDSFTDQTLSQLNTLIIPASHYQKITTQPGKMPEIVITIWQSIWKMSEQELGGKRRYQADFEIYDEKAADLNHAIVDIYVGVVE